LSANLTLPDYGRAARQIRVRRFLILSQCFQLPSFGQLCGGRNVAFAGIRTGRGAVCNLFSRLTRLMVLAGSLLVPKRVNSGP